MQLLTSLVSASGPFAIFFLQSFSDHAKEHTGTAAGSLGSLIGFNMSSSLL
jgi:hypothetical protein